MWILYVFGLAIVLYITGHFFQMSIPKYKEYKKLGNERMSIPNLTNDLELKKEYTVKVAGVTFDNKSGSSRQEIISKCSKGQKIYLHHHFTNAFDSNAIEVLTSKGMVGYLPKSYAEQTVSYAKKGGAVTATVGRVYHPSSTNGAGMRIILKFWLPK